MSKKTYNYTTAATISTTLLDTVNYTYGSAQWQDKLTGIDNTTISYDAIGNPLNWNGIISLSWDGQKLEELTVYDQYNDPVNYSYTYNEIGIRTSKLHTVPMCPPEGYSVDYVLDGTKILTEINRNYYGNIVYTLDYYYDENDSPIGFSYNGTQYFYKKNHLGDVTAIYNGAGSKVVVYEYDAWGNIISMTGSLASGWQAKYRLKVSLI